MPAERKGLRRAYTTILVATIVFCLSACAAETHVPRKIALLAPFEGQYRDIGYNALYALRMAFADTRPHDTQLLAIDDGGTVESAIDRVRALNLDPAVESCHRAGTLRCAPNRAIRH